MISDLKGNVIREHTGQCGQELFLPLSGPVKMYLLRILKKEQTYNRKIVCLRP